MKELAKKKIVRLCDLLKEIFVFLLYLFIIASYYYICMYTYNLFDIDNCELINVCTINLEELKPVSQRNIWHKYILDDFFNKFITKNKTINPKVMEIKANYFIKTSVPLEPEHNINIEKKSIILNKIKDDYINNLILECEFHKNKTKSLEIQDDYVNNLISECEFYKNKTRSLEIQVLKTKISFQDLIRDISSIVKEIPNQSEK